MMQLNFFKFNKHNRSYDLFVTLLGVFTLRKIGCDCPLEHIFAPLSRDSLNLYVSYTDFGRDDQQPEQELEPEYRSFDRSRSRSHFFKIEAGVCFFLTDFLHFLVQMSFANLLKLHY